MHRSKLVLSVLCICLASLLSVAGWVSYAYLRSQPLANGQVLAASTDIPNPTLLPVPARTNSGLPYINAARYALYNVESGRLLYGQNENEETPIASTTKLMTAFIVSRIGNLDDIVSISDIASSQPGSLMQLKRDEKISVRNLIRGALMVSGNDAAMALGEYGGGILLHDPQASHDDRITRFVLEMNTVATHLGMTHTHYMDPAGLNDDGHSSAFDLARLTHHVLENDTMRTTIHTADMTITDVSGQISHELKNSNRLVSEYNYDGVIGGKTGFTPAAGHCLVSAASRNGMTLIAVILGTGSPALQASAVEARKLLDWGFASWTLELR